MINAGVPVVPGTWKKLNTEKEIQAVLEDIGLPVMVKASAGGGGKGMRLVKTEKELPSAVKAARC